MPRLARRWSPLAALSLRASLSLALPLVAPLAAGCRHEGDEELGLGRRAPAHATPTALDPARIAQLAQPGVLEHTLAEAATTAPAVDGKLGPHRRTQELHLTLVQGERKESVVESWRTDSDGKGGVHASHTTTRAPRWDGGVEWWLVGDRYSVRLLHGRAVTRDPQGDEVERAREEQEGPLADYLAVLGRFAARADKGATTVASLNGRAAHTIALSLTPSPAALVDDGEPAHAWRKTLAVRALDGTVDLDDATAAPLRAKLEATYSYSMNGKETTVTLAYTSSVEPLPGEAAPGGVIRPPDDAQPEGPRARPLVDRAVLLDGLAAPKGAVAAPSASTGGAAAP